MNDPTTVSDFGRLVPQIGAISVVALGLLTLVVGLVKQLASHALKQNEELVKQQHDMQMKTLEALHAMGTRLEANNTKIDALRVEMTRDFGQLFNEVSSVTE